MYWTCRKSEGSSHHPPYWTLPERRENGCREGGRGQCPGGVRLAPTVHSLEGVSQLCRVLKKCWAQSSFCFNLRHCISNEHFPGPLFCSLSRHRHPCTAFRKGNLFPLFWTLWCLPRSAGVNSNFEYCCVQLSAGQAGFTRYNWNCGGGASMWSMQMKLRMGSSLAIVQKRHLWQEIK